MARTARKRRAAARTGDWSAVPFVLPRGGLARDAARRWFRRQRLDPKLAAEVDGHEALLTLVALGIVPRLVLDTSTVKDRLAAVPTDRHLHHRPGRPPHRPAPPDPLSARASVAAARPAN